MTNDKSREEFAWYVAQSGNPNKAWVCCNGDKLSALMTLKAARELVRLHNASTDFHVLAAHKESTQAARIPLLADLKLAREALRKVSYRAIDMGDHYNIPIDDYEPCVDETIAKLNKTLGSE